MGLSFFQSNRVDLLISFRHINFCLEEFWNFHVEFWGQGHTGKIYIDLGSHGVSGGLLARESQLHLQLFDFLFQQGVFHAVLVQLSCIGQLRGCLLVLTLDLDEFSLESGILDLESVDLNEEL